MNVHSTAPTDPDAFLRWNEGREGKRELVRGEVVEHMINVTRAHAYIVTRLLFELTAALDPARYEAYAVDIGLKTSDGVHSTRCADREPSAAESAVPVLRDGTAGLLAVLPDGPRRTDTAGKTRASRRRMLSGAVKAGARLGGRGLHPGRGAPAEPVRLQSPVRRPAKNLLTGCPNEPAVSCTRLTPDSSPA